MSEKLPEGLERVVESFASMMAHADLGTCRKAARDVLRTSGLVELVGAAGDAARLLDDACADAEIEDRLKPNAERDRLRAALGRLRGEREG